MDEVTVEDYEEGIAICQDIERNIDSMEIESEHEEKILSLALARHPGGPTKEQLSQCRDSYILEHQRGMMPNALVLPIHKTAPYAIWTQGSSLVDQLGIITGRDNREFEEGATLRALEESIPENTLRAYRGDIRYIGAWLLAMRKDFWEPLSEQWVERFIIDHLKGVDEEEGLNAERCLIQLGFKAKTGPHSFETVKRRLAALSNFCKAKGWDNPARSERVRFLMRQLSKKFASTRQPRAITRNTLIHLLDNVSKDTTGLRDSALLAFIFATGGRRRK